MTYIKIKILIGMCEVETCEDGTSERLHHFLFIEKYNELTRLDSIARQGNGVDASIGAPQCNHHIPQQLHGLEGEHFVEPAVVGEVPDRARHRNDQVVGEDDRGLCTQDHGSDDASSEASQHGGDERMKPVEGRLVLVGRMNHH